MELPEISLDTPLSSVGSNVLVETEGGRAILRSITTKHGANVHAHLSDGRRLRLDRVPGDRTVRQAIAAVSAERPLRAFQLPPGLVRSRLRPLQTALSYLPWIIGVAAAAVGALAEPLGWLRFLLLGTGITILVVAHDASKKAQRHRAWALESKGELTRLEGFALPAPAIQADVDDVKEEYGRLLSDIAYRIECPALFDPHEPTSKEFTLALLQWDNNDGVLSDEERSELARRVRATFTAARANAERIGMDHLPEPVRGPAATALKAARLAADEAATAPERETALQRAVDILDELALYYLPTGAQARKAITGGTMPQLPGRRSA